MSRTNFDTDLLRTFVSISECGSFAHAADRVHRTQSAVSLQMKRLEQQAGARLFRRDGRRMALTEDGNALLGYAKRILELNDEAVDAIGARHLSGPVRFGTIQDFADNRLTEALARFSRAHPEVRLEVLIDRSATMEEALARQELDLVLTLGPAGMRPDARLRREKLAWFAAADFACHADAPLPLVLCEQPCMFRDVALESLNRIGRAWHVILTSPSVAGVWAAVHAGLGVTIRGAGMAADDVMAIGPGDGFPALPAVDVLLCRAAEPTSPAAEKLAEIVSDVMAPPRRGPRSATAVRPSAS